MEQVKKSKIFLPPDIEEISFPAVFLNGPVYDDINWQEEAINIFKENIPWANIVSPRRKNHSEFFLYNDRIWRKNSLEQVAEKGVVLFWFPEGNEGEIDPISIFELGELMVKHLRGETRIVVGIDPFFPRAKYIAEEVRQNIMNLTIHSCLEDVCKDAMEYLKSL